MPEALCVAYMDVYNAIQHKLSWIVHLDPDGHKSLALWKTKLEAEKCSVLYCQVWRTRATLMGVFSSLFKVCFSFIYRYECFKTLSYTFIYFLLLLLYCSFTSFYTDHSDRLGS